MYLAPDDARSDLVLVGAVLLFGGAARAFVSSATPLPTGGVLAVVVDLVWIVALTALVPVLLARYRGDGPAAFGLEVPRSGAAAGLVLVLPVAALGAVLAVTVLRDPTTALTGQVLAGFGGASLTPLGIVARASAFLAVSVGSLLMVGFLAVRSREAFPRSPEITLTELTRTFGMGAALAALVLGVGRGLGPGSLVVGVSSAVAAALVVLLADRLVPPGLTVPRTTVVAPMLLVAFAHVGLRGGLFRGDLIGGLASGALAASITVVIAALAQTRRGAWAALPLVLAVHWWPTCLSPLTLAGGIC